MAVNLECRDLSFTYQDHPVLNHISFKVRSGRFCAILGRNGSGKTTLLHCLNNILSPDSGKVLVHGQDILAMGRAPFLGLSQRPDKSDYKMAEDALNFLNAGALATKNFNRLSGGSAR